ncbi:hypothetical protein ScPMuIL_008057 [Solemya velum]
MRFLEVGVYRNRGGLACRHQDLGHSAETVGTHALEVLRIQKVDMNERSSWQPPALGIQRPVKSSTYSIVGWLANYDSIFNSHNIMERARVLRYIQISFHGSFLVAGIALLIVGLTTLNAESLGSWDFFADVLADVPVLVRACSLIFIIGGALVVFVASVGCTTIYREGKCFACLYNFFLVSLMMAEMSFGLYAFAFTSRIDNGLRNGLKELVWENYLGESGSRGGSDVFTTAVDKYQIEYGCCGVVDHTDYYNATGWNKTVLYGWNVHRVDGVVHVARVPWSCCKPSKPDGNYFSTFVPRNTVGCQVYEFQNSTNINNGCYQIIKEKIKENSVALIVVAILLGSLQFIGTTVSCLVMFPACRCEPDYDPNYEQPNYGKRVPPQAELKEQPQEQKESPGKKDRKPKKGTKSAPKVERARARKSQPPRGYKQLSTNTIQTVGRKREKPKIVDLSSN